MAAVHSPALLEQLAEVARAAAAAGHGGKSRVYEAAAKRMGCSVATLLQRIKLVRVGAPRKRRADAGGHALSRDEAALIAATVEETRRLTGTGALALEHAVEILRSNGKIAAGRVDTDTGEFTPLSVSAVRRALRHYNMHPEQLAEPTPAARLQSPHPNWCWQIDASVSRQFYLADDGTRVMPEREFYRGKPGNLVAINDYRLWRYVVTDHASGALEPEDVAALVDALEKLVPLGLEVEQSVIRDKLGLPDPDPKGVLLRAPAASVAPVMNRALNREGTETDAADLQAQTLSREVAPAWEAVLDQVEAIVQRAESLEDLRAQLLAAYGELTKDQLGEVMAMAFAAAELAGRYELSEESARG